MDSEFPLDNSELGNLLIALVSAERDIDELSTKSAEITLAKRKVQEAQFWITAHVSLVKENECKQPQ